MATSIGKAFEAELEDTFRQLKASHLLGWHRFPDTHSAGGSIIQPQPSDYLIGLPRGAKVPLPGRGGTDQRTVFFEAKATEKHKTLQKSAISPDQRGFVHFYAGMLGLPYIICHYSAVTGGMQLWDGRAVMEARLDRSRYLLTEFYAGEGRKLHKDQVAEALTEFFALPAKHKTVKLYKQV